MDDFGVLPDGRVIDIVAERVVDRHLELCPWADRLACSTSLTFFRAYSALEDRLAPHWLEFGLSAARFNVLRLLAYSSEGHLALAEIGEGLHSTTTNATKLVEGLEREGLVRRHRHPSDRRVTLVSLTEEGRKRFDAMLPHLLRQVGELFSGLSAEEKLLLAHLLAKFHVNAASQYVEKSPVARELLNHRVALGSSGKP